MNEKRVEMGKAIVEFEGRFDKNEKLAVYKLPPGDGGGAYEVAGINDRYHPTMAKQLKDLIESGQHQRVLREASEYIEVYTRPVLKFFPTERIAEENPAIEFVLRDSAFNRGNKGAAAILQIALDVKVDGIVGPATKEAFSEALDEFGKENFLRRITQARETYERNSYPWKSGKRDESSKFWAGLSNRWAKAHKTAQTRFA